MRWIGHVGRIGEKRNIHRSSVGKPEGTRLLGKLRHKWVHNIKLDHGRIGWDAVA
jgi:hypothetical protein